MRFNLDRLQIKLERGQIRLAKSMNTGGMIADALLAERGVSAVIVDSITEIVGTKQYDRQVALAKHWKSVAVKHQIPVSLIVQMNKSGDTLGMSALAHSADALIEVQVIDDGRRRARILRQYGLDDGDVRLCTAVKHRFGPTHIDHPLLMTAHGFTEIPKAMKETTGKTGDPIRDEILSLDQLDEQIEQSKAITKELSEERDERKLKLAKMATEPAAKVAKLGKLPPKLKSRKAS